jgi:hypothetical protein
MYNDVCTQKAFEYSTKVLGKQPVQASFKNACFPLYSKKLQAYYDA